MLVREGAVRVLRGDQAPYLLKGYDLYSVGPYPGVKVSKNPAAAVTVEVYSVSEAALRTLDYFEGHPDHYRRESVMVLNGVDGETLPAQIYLYQLDPDRRLPLVISGDWIAHLAARQVGR